MIWAKLYGSVKLAFCAEYNTKIVYTIVKVSKTHNSIELVKYAIIRISVVVIGFI